jgi:putative DNA primase/helicase
VVGAYGKAMPHNLLFGDKGNPEFADAAIFGYRVMTLSEPPMQSELNTTKLKQLSGGDSITGRLPYGREEISFTPECSLWLMTNHALEVSDEAVWRRLKFFNFEHSWEEDKGEIPELRKAITQDPGELRLALAWMLAGAKAWARDGWGDTEMWRTTVLEEKSLHDPLMKWVTDCVEVTGLSTDGFGHADMLVSFDFWLVSNGEHTPPMSRNQLRGELEGHCVRAGMTHDKTTRRMIGGRLR